MTTALRDRGRTHGQDLTADSTFTAAATMWRPTLEGKASATRTAYTRALDRDLLPAMGGRRLREITTQTVEQTITTLTNRRINHLESHNPTTTPTDHRGATA